MQESRYGTKRFDVKIDDFDKLPQHTLEYVIENHWDDIARAEATQYITDPEYLEFLYVSDDRGNVKRAALERLEKLSKTSPKAGKLYRSFLRQKKKHLFARNAEIITGFFKCFDPEKRPIIKKLIPYDKDSPRQNLKHHKILKRYRENNLYQDEDFDAIHYFAAPTGKSEWKRWGYGYYQESLAYAWVILIKRLTYIGNSLQYEYMLADCDRSVAEADSIFTHVL